jgi:hypothetical protein
LLKWSSIKLLRFLNLVQDRQKPAGLLDLSQGFHAPAASSRDSRSSPPRRNAASKRMIGGSGG